MTEQRLREPVHAEKYFGKYPGRVVANVAPAGGAHRGELMIEVPGILEEAPGGAGQRPLQALAKPCFAPGVFHVPEVNSPVWVEFVAGDINLPVWTGVWIPKDAAPATADEKAPTEKQKVLRTTAGHVIELDDGSPKVVVLDANGNRITADDKGLSLADLSGNKIIMDENGIRIADASGNELVMSSAGITLKSEAVKIGGDGAAEPLVLGNKWLSFFNSHMHTGNMGAPTSPPLPPATPVPLSVKHFTE